jgi:hypothetical protein
MLVALVLLLAAPSLLDRELPEGALRLYAFKSEDGTLAGEAKATAPPVVTAGHVELKVGEAADPIDCEVVRGRIDPATRAFRAVEDLKKANLTTMEPALVEVSVASEAPLLIFDVPYTKTIAQGEFKLAMLSSAGVSFACSQDTAGFRGTFRTAVLSLANSLRDPTREVRPRKFHQIEIVKADGAPVGIYETVVQDAEGGLEERRFRTLIVRSGPAAVRTKDAQTRQFERGGSVVDGGYAVRIDDVLSEAQLSREKDGRYAVKGKQAEKPFEKVLAAPDGLSTETLLQAALRALVAKKIDARKFQTFDVEKPDGLLTFSLRRDPARAGTILMEGDVVPAIEIEVDRSGRSKGSTVTTGARRLTTETIFFSGSLP